MLVYPRSYSGSTGMSCSLRYAQTSRFVHSASGLTLRSSFPLGRRAGARDWRVLQGPPNPRVLSIALAASLCAALPRAEEENWPPVENSPGEAPAPAAVP